MVVSEETQLQFIQAIQEQKEDMIARLAKWVSIISVSCQADRRQECHDMMDFAKSEFDKLGAKMRLVKNPAGMQMFQDGTEVEYPPILLGTYPAEFDSNKKTICLYGHLDVQPAQMSDGWDSDPWKLEERDGKLYGRGSTDDKGPVLGWLVALETMKKLGIDLPVNLKFCFEGMEESGSVGLNECIRETEKDFFYPGVDGVCISDNYWLGTEKPCLTYGLRGMTYYAVTVECSKQDLHSGVFGGTVHEAMTDLVQIMSSFVDSQSRITVEGIMDQVDPVTAEEEASYGPIDFCTKTYADSISGNLLNEGKKETLMGRWRYPTLSLHGIEGAFAEPGEKTVIPRRVVGKFSLRLVPSMTPDAVHQCLEAHMEKVKKKLNTPNKIWLQNRAQGLPWVGNTGGFIFTAAKRATKRVYNVEPDMTREGGSIPVTLTFQESTQSDVILIPMGAGDDGAHSQNEKINVRNFIDGTKLLGSFLLELGNV